LGVIAQQQKNQYDEAKREREHAKLTTLSKFFGDSMLAHLLRMLHLPNEAAVNATCPVYLKMAHATKARQRGELDISVQEELDRRGNPYLMVHVPPGVFAHHIGLMWAHINENSLTSGSLANLYLWWESDEDMHQALGLRADLVLSGDMHCG